MAILTKIEKNSRYEIIADYIGEGLRTFQIIEKICSKWELKPRQAQRVIAEAKKWIEAEHKEDRDATRIRAINRYKYRIKRLQELSPDDISTKDREALIKDYLKQIDELEGNKLPERIEVAKMEQKDIQITIVPTTDISAIERKKKIAKHYKDRGQELPAGFKRDLKKYMD